MKSISHDAEECLDELAAVITRDKLTPDCVAERLEMISYFYRDVLEDDARDWILTKLREPLAEAERLRVELSELLRIRAARNVVGSEARRLFSLAARLQTVEAFVSESGEMSAGDRLILQQATEIAEDLATTRIGTWEWDFGTDKAVMSQGMLDMYGLTHADGEDEAFERWTGRTHPDDLELVQSSIISAVDNLESFKVQFRVTRADGKLRTFRCGGDVLGGTTKMVGMIRDVTRPGD